MNVKQEEEPLTGLGRGGTLEAAGPLPEGGARPGAGITPIWQVGNRRPGMLAEAASWLRLRLPAPPSRTQPSSCPCASGRVVGGQAPEQTGPQRHRQVKVTLSGLKSLALPFNSPGRPLSSRNQTQEKEMSD